jgi:raffinose/stachyose/melibiose transport system permease protein
MQPSTGSLVNRIGAMGKKHRRWSLRPIDLFIISLLLMWAVANVLPVAWVAVAGLKTDVEIFRRPFALPQEWRFDNYSAAFRDANIARYLYNTLVFAGGTTALSLLLAALCAFPFARFEFRLKGMLWAFLMAMFLLPDSLRMIPLIVNLIRFGFYGTMSAMIVAYATGGVPFSAFFLRAYMESIPRELEEAAVIDGANMWQVFRWIIVPLAKPALATLAIFNFLKGWNELFFVVLLSKDSSTFTIPAGIASLSSRMLSQHSLIAAAFMITLLPVLVVFIFAQQHVVKGMTAGALKGV